MRRPKKGNARRQVSADDAGNDGKGGYRSVDAAVDPIPEVALTRLGGKPLAYGFVRVLMLQARFLDSGFHSPKSGQLWFRTLRGTH